MIYITQYGFWWSTTPEGWKAIVEHVLNLDENEGYDLDQLAKPLKNRPSSVRISGDRRSGDFFYYTNKPEDRIFKPLDWDRSDWEQAKVELGWLKKK